MTRPARPFTPAAARRPAENLKIVLALGGAAAVQQLQLLSDWTASPAALESRGSTSPAVATAVAPHPTLQSLLTTQFVSTKKVGETLPQPMTFNGVALLVTHYPSLTHWDRSGRGLLQN